MSQAQVIPRAKLSGSSVKNKFTFSDYGFSFFVGDKMM